MNINETVAAMKAAIKEGDGGGQPFGKAYTVGLGLVNYDLEAGAKLLFPWGEKITPLRNMVPRDTSVRGDTAHRWKQITAINTGHVPPGLSEGNRGGVIATTVQNMLSNYVGLGEEDYVTYEGKYAAMGFDDVLAIASSNLLKSLMIDEERMILGGNGIGGLNGNVTQVQLGTPTTPTLTGSATTGGALSNGTFYVSVVALTQDGFQRASVATGVVQQISRTNADLSSDTISGGTSIPSAVANVTLAGGTSTQTLPMSTPVVLGAVAYAWYIGTAAAHQYLAAITTINSFVLTTAVPATTFQDAQTLTAVDYSNIGTYGFPGFLYQGPFVAASGAYYAALGTGVAGAGTQLTTDNAGGIAQINAMLKDRYDNYRLSFDTLWLSSQEMLSLKILIVKNGGAPLIRLIGNLDAGTIKLTAGTIVGVYINPITGDEIPMRVHPFQTPGTILGTTRDAPYADSRLSTLFEMKCRQEYYSVLWPQTTRKYQYGAYVDETLVYYFPPGLGAITNIAPTLS